MKKAITVICAFALVASVFAAGKGTVLQDGCSVWKENEAGEMVWKASVAAGTAVSTGETKKAVQVTSSKKYDDVEFIKVTYNKKEEGWIVANRVAPEGVSGLVINECAVYRSDSPATSARFTLPFGTCITVTGIVKKIGSLSLSEVYCFDPDAYAVRKSYIRTDKVSTKDQDLKVMAIIAKVTDKMDDQVRNELLASALSVNASEQVKEFVVSVDKKYNPDKYVVVESEDYGDDESSEESPDIDFEDSDSDDAENNENLYSDEE